MAGEDHDGRVGSPEGICPHCEAAHGPVGAPCPQTPCLRRGYRFIPTRWHDSAREFAARHRRPLDPLLGRLLDKYLLCGPLGEGGMGAVYVALQMPLRREVALKLISGLQLTDAAVARFEREARAISALEHPNIVKLFDYGVGELDFAVPYMVLEYVRHGRTLGEALARARDEHGGVLPTEVVLEVFRQVLHALAAAHKVGIIHRDMKPDNVMIAPVEGQPYLVKVLDFGLAKAVAEVTTQDGWVGPQGGVSRTGQILGTPYYMAPEQAPARGRPHADPRSDLYAVGVMIFEVFTGVRAFDGQTPLEVLMKKGDPTCRPLDLPEARSLPAPLRAFLERAMAVNPADRFPSADDMLAALEGSLSEPGVAARGPVAPDGAADRPRTPTSKDSATLGDERARTPASRGEPEDGAPASRTPGWAMAPVPGEDSATAGPWPDEALSVPADRPRRSAWPWIGAGAAAVGIAMGAWVALGPDEVPGPAPDVPTPPPVAVQAPPPVPLDVLPGPDRIEADPGPRTVMRSFVIETPPPGARVEVEGRVLGNAPVTYQFPATGDEWRDREVVVRASGTGLLPASRTVVLARAVEEGRVEVPLQPARKTRRHREPEPPRGLDGILGPDVEAGRVRTPPERPAPPPPPEPPPPPRRKEPPPKKPAIPML